MSGERPLEIGDRVVITLYRRGSGNWEPFDAPGELVEIMPSTRPPHRPCLGLVRLDDREHGERYLGLSQIRREVRP